VLLFAHVHIYLQVETLFDMFDPMGKGSISGSQYRAALEAINVENPIASVVREIL